MKQPAEFFKTRLKLRCITSERGILKAAQNIRGTSANCLDSLEHRFRGRSLLGCCILTHGGIPSYLYFAAETILGDRVRLASSWPPS